MKTLIVIGIVALTGCTMKLSPDIETEKKFQAVEKWSAGVYQNLTTHEDRIRALEVKAGIATPAPAVKK